MRIVIVGGGKVGYYLMKVLMKKRHTIQLIDKNKAVCEKIADELLIPVHLGDATKIEDLRSAGTLGSDVFISVTGQDEENLIACQLAKTNLKSKRTIARVNNPENIKVFEALGVDIAVSSTSVISSLIEEEVDDNGMKTLASLKDDRIILSEIKVRPESLLFQKKIKDIRLPDGCRLISIIKNDDIMQPNPELDLGTGDSMLVVSDLESLESLRKMIPATGQPTMIFPSG